MFLATMHFFVFRHCEVRCTEAISGRMVTRKHPLFRNTRHEIASCLPTLEPV